ncbi:MAG: hypothetical protein GYA51_17040 [Candidatus Methanofastidiosa archaeon]|nr:hypothetical protein [Candidatus Methanofastidiosa archaeon]
MPLQTTEGERAAKITTTKGTTCKPATNAVLSSFLIELKVIFGGFLFGIY